MTLRRITIDGRDGVVMFLDGDRHVSLDRATQAKVFFLDGETKFYPVHKGGAGSGNFGHAGRPGQVGGSTPGSGAAPPPPPPVSTSGPHPAILEAIRQADGGFTYNPITKTLQRTGYALSIHKDRERVLPVRDVTAVTIAQYVKDNADLLRQPGKYLGGWHNPDDGMAYLDVSTVVDTPAEAERLGRAAKQLAYFDLAKGESVAIKEMPVHGEGAKTHPVFGRPRQRAHLIRGPTRIGPSSHGSRAHRRRSRRRAQTVSIHPTVKGGPGSGNFGHEGRPGRIGGSAPSSGGSSTAVGLIEPPTSGVGGPMGVTPQVQQDAAAYATANGFPPITHGYVEVDQPRAGRIADAYDALPVDDRANPDVRRAYDALGREIQAQWDFARARGMTFEPWTREGQPYANSKEMVADVRTNRHLYFYQGGEPHPSLADPDAFGLSLNDKLRAVHDYFGHAAGGYGFGPRGEENAWRTHSQMFSPWARKAMTTETRGQNSWVNFGRQNYDAQGHYKHIPPAQRLYAVQKVALLPDEFVRLDKGEPFVRKPTTLNDAEELAYRRPPKPAMPKQPTKGGPGSGNFGHAGRPGQVGGSATGDGGQPTADPEQARRRSIVERRARDVAEALNVNPDRITVVDEEPHAFHVGNQLFKEAAHYDPKTGEIQLNVQQTYDDSIDVTAGVAAHEVSHAIYDAALGAQQAEHDEIASLPPEEYKRLFTAGGFVRPETQAEVHQRYPVSAMFYRHLGDSLMETEQEADQSVNYQQSRYWRNRAALENNGHLTAYSTAYWNAANRPNGFERALDETLAEYAHRRVVPADAWHGLNPPNARWEKFSNDLLAIARSPRVHERLQRRRKSWQV